MKIIIFFVISLFLLGCTTLTPNTPEEAKDSLQPDAQELSQNETVTTESATDETTMKKEKTNTDWQKDLTPEEYDILINKGTERPFTGELLKEKRKGTYVTAGCKIPVFRSDTKFDSGTGWPSFYDANKENIILKEDNSLLGKRIEVLSKCGEHLGHLFDDGPKPTGKRYCINSLALEFVPDEKQ